jgi:hypothetical protein
MALTACNGGGDDAAATLPPVTPTPSPTEAAGSDVPPEAQEDTPEGAAEFARYYVLEVREAYLSKDAERIRRLSEAGCGTCEQYVTTVESLISENATVGDAYVVEVTDAIAPTLPPGATEARATVTSRQGEFVVTNDQGQVLYREEPVDIIVQDFRLVRVEGGWKVADVVRS